MKYSEYGWHEVTWETFIGGLIFAVVLITILSLTFLADDGNYKASPRPDTTQVDK